MAPTSLARDVIDPKPYFPTVNAIAPKAAIGATFITMPTTLNIACENASRTLITGFARRPMWNSAIPNMIENNRICRISLRANESTILLGIMFRKKSTADVLCGADV
ncbi:hypothetical protein D3C87_1833100 [compost metagenome]